MAALLALVPLPWKLASGALVFLAIIGGYFGWQHHQRSIGAAGVIAADAKAVDDQKAKDKTLSDKEAADTKARTDALEAIAKPARDKIATDAPDQADLDAAKAVACMIDKSKC